MFNFVRKSHTTFQSDCAILQIYQQCKRDIIFFNLQADLFDLYLILNVYMKKNFWLGGVRAYENPLWHESNENTGKYCQNKYFQNSGN